MQITDFDAFSKDTFEPSDIKNPVKNPIKLNSTYRVKQNSKRSQGDFNSKDSEHIGKFRSAGRSATLQKRPEVKL
jgi:hypothetical protein